MEESSSTYTEESLGTLLRTIRIERSLDISEVAQETRIPPETLRAMEADDYKALPAMAFARFRHSATMLPDGRALIAGGWNGALLATGEVVVVDDHFAVRITKLLNRVERLKKVL